MSTSGVPEQITEDTSDWTAINIEAPLPMSVAGTLMSLIGAAWPDAVIVTGKERKHYGDRGYGLNLKIPPDVPPKTVDEEFVEAIRGEHKAESEGGEFLGFDDGWVAFTPPEELCLHLGQVAHGIFTAHEPQAVNYVEWQVRVGNEPDDPQYQLSIAKSKEQAPGALWHKEKGETARLRALLEKHGIDPDEEV